MRFAGKKVKLTGDPEKPVIQVDPDSLKYTPELPEPTPKQQYERDNYIFRPESGVAMSTEGAREIAGLPAALVRLGILKDITDRPVNSGTRMTPEQEYDIYESPTLGPRVEPTLESPRDRQFMDIMNSGFV